MSVPVSLLRMLPPAASNPALPSLGWAQWAFDVASDQKPPTDEPDKWTKVVGRYRTLWIENGEKYCVSPPLTSSRDEFADFPTTPAPPPSLMPIPDEPFYAEQRGPPQATEPSLIPVYHRSRTEWIREGDTFAFTPGYNLEQFNPHLCGPKPETAASWSQASAWALAQKYSESSKKE